MDLPHSLATHTGHGWEYFVDPESGEAYRINLDSGGGDAQAERSLPIARLKAPGFNPWNLWFVGNFFGSPSSGVAKCMPDLSGLYRRITSADCLSLM